MKFLLKFLIILTFTISSCRFARDEKALSAYIADPDHGLSQEKTVNGVTIRATYRPLDFLVKQHLSAVSARDADTIRKIKDHYYKQLYFLVSVSVNQKELLTSYAGNQAQFNEMLNTLSFGLSENIHLYTETHDTLQLADYVYPRMYGMSKSTDMLLVFQNKDLSESGWLKLTIFIPGLNTGEIAFKFKIESINQIPELKLQ